MKTVLFIPGFQEDIKSRDYASIIKAIEKAGYRVEFVDINWKRTTIQHWVDEFSAIYKNYNPKTAILAGFSYGAMTAFMAATERSPSELWLFSLSPYFAEDIADPTFKKSWLNGIGHRRVDTFKALSFKKLVKRITSKIKFFYGEVELTTFPDITYRHKIAKANSHMQTVLVPNAKHDVASKVYIDAIEDSIKM